MARGEHATIEAVRADLAARDEADRNRTAAPLIAAPDATILDTTNLDADAAFENAIEIIKGK